jgi:large repetitive protein
VEGNSGTTNAVFSVILSGPNSKPTSITYATANGTALAGKDYKSTSGTLTIPAGQTTGKIIVPVIGDRLPEGNETFLVKLLSATNKIAIARTAVSGTIRDDDPSPTTPSRGAAVSRAAEQLAFAAAWSDPASNAASASRRGPKPTGAAVDEALLRLLPDGR